MNRITVALVILIALFLVGFIWWTRGLQPANPKNTTPKIFVIKPGVGVREIANNLKSEGLIKDPVVFFLLARQKGLDKQIQAGNFRLSPSMNALETATSLTHGTLDIWVTVTEGLRADEIADILKEKVPSFDESWRPILEQNEGYLFPDTYLIPRDGDINLVVSLLRDNFDKKYDSVKSTKTTNLTDAQTVIVASMVEREAAFPKDRPMVASVILNRLDLGMPLQIDATVQYALGYQDDTKSWWKKDLTFEDLKIVSFYNTYQHSALPIGPISNPGLSALEAALNPSDTIYLYYYSDKDGHLHFASTVEGHNQNIEKYRPD